MSKVAHREVKTWLGVAAQAVKEATHKSDFYVSGRVGSEFGLLGRDTERSKRTATCDWRPSAPRGAEPLGGMESQEEVPEGGRLLQSSWCEHASATPGDESHRVGGGQHEGFARE